MRRLTRRALLASAGLGAATALVGPLASRLAQAGSALPRRFVFVVEGNGYEPVTVLTRAARAEIDATAHEPVGSKRWWYRDYGHDTPLQTSAEDWSSAPALGALATPELTEQAAVLLGLSSRIAGGGHSSSHGALASARTIGGVPGGQTIDAWLAAVPRVRGDAPYDAVRLGVGSNTGEALDFGTCAFARGRAAPLVLRPSSAFDALFGSVGVAGSRAAFGRRRALLDYAHGDIDAALQSFPGSSDERAKLEAYLAAVETLTDRHERILGMESDLEASRPEAPGTNPLYGSGDPLDRFRAHLELATAALMGELTHVAVIGCGTGGDFDLTYPTVSPNVSRHDMHHGSAGSADLRQRIHEVTRLQVEAVAAMASDLAAIPEIGADGSMLDHTVIVFLGDNGEQHHSTASEFPIVVMGGAALGLELGGRTVAYPGIDAGGHRQLSNLWNTLGYAAGEALDDFGAEGPARRAEGPLAELLA